MRMVVKSFHERRAARYRDMATKVSAYDALTKALVGDLGDGRYYNSKVAVTHTLPEPLGNIRLVVNEDNIVTGLIMNRKYHDVDTRGPEGYLELAEDHDRWSRKPFQGSLVMMFYPIMRVTDRAVAQVPENLAKDLRFQIERHGFPVEETLRKIDEFVEGC